MKLNDDDATMLATILASADGGCSNCVGQLADQMEDAFPGNGWRERIMFALDPTYYDPPAPRDPNAEPATVAQVSDAIKEAWWR